MKLKKAPLYLLCALTVAFTASCNKGTDPEDPDPSIDIPIEEGTTVCGRIYYGSDKTPLKDVVVTDGILFTKTDAQGIYQLKSKKKNSLVYITVPSGYTVKTLTTGSTQPNFYQQLTKDSLVAEQHNFVLTKDSGQTTHTRLLFGDIHIYSDMSCRNFTTFSTKINNELKSGVLKKPFGLTLGDMSWDWFWYENNYKIVNYLQQINQISGLQVFCTVGNHDHDMKYKNAWWNSKQELVQTGEDWTCEIPYRKLQGPTCYSTDIGNVHYVSMDDALTIDDGTGEKDGRGCELGFTETDLNWLRNDMSLVPSDRTVVLTVHIPLTTKLGKMRDVGSDCHYTLAQMLEPFKGRTGKLLVISAHCHYIFNNEDFKAGDVTFTEWNSPAVCGNFWSSSNCGMNLCSDGTPGGYRILEFTGPNITCAKYVPTEFTAIKRADFYPFRTYDVNQIKFSDQTKYPTITYQKTWYNDFVDHALADGYWLGSSDNYVDIFVWDWKSGWTIKVTETLADGSTRTLNPVRKERFYDGLAMLALVESKGGASELQLNTTTFRVQASAPDTKITVEVKDEYGFSAKEVMARPKTFSWAAYKNELASGYSK